MSILISIANNLELKNSCKIKHICSLPLVPVRTLKSAPISKCEKNLNTLEQNQIRQKQKRGLQSDQISWNHQTKRTVYETPAS